jgi:hypothetical protein
MYRTRIRGIRRRAQMPMSRSASTLQVYTIGFGILEN